MTTVHRALQIVSAVTVALEHGEKWDSHVLALDQVTEMLTRAGSDLANINDVWRKLAKERAP